MLQKSKLFLTIALVLLVCFASITSAFAAGLDGNGALVGNEANPVQATITKNLRVPVGTNVPNATFLFTATPVSVNDDTSTTALGTMPNLQNLSVTYSAGPVDPTTVPVTNNIMSLQKETGNIFDGVTFPHAGIFVYEITEDENASYTVLPNQNNEWISHSKAKYTLTVYVANNAAGTGTFVSALGTVVTTTDHDGQTQDGKVDPTPGGDKSTYFFSQMVFTNDYVKTNGPQDPDNPDPLKESTLVVSKMVTGDFANRSQYFDYEMTLTIPEILSNIPASYKAYVVVKSGGAVDLAELVKPGVGTVIGSDAGGTYIEIATDKATSFALRDGIELVFVDTPVGTTYTVEKLPAVNYTPSYSVTTNGGSPVEIAGALHGGLSTGTQFVGELENRADFVSTRDSVTPTGLNLNDLPFIVLVVLGLSGLALFLVVKVRSGRSA